MERYISSPREPNELVKKYLLYVSSMITLIFEKKKKKKFKMQSYFGENKVYLHICNKWWCGGGIEKKLPWLNTLCPE